MRLTFRTEEDLQAALHREFLAGEKAVSLAMDRVGSGLKRDWRGQITGAGLGRRLANTIRAKRYPEGQESMDAAALVWSKAPEIVGAHDRGALIRSKDGFWLAIPLPAAGKGRGGKRITPGEWERRRGVSLRFVYRRGRPSLLVADSARLSRRGLALQKRGRRRKKDGILTGEQTVPIFILVPQVKLSKRLDLARSAEAVARGVPNAIVNIWR
ncbi:MAG: hypothetical protein D6773_14135 [Alphaproteobacteria bacterium]|nr:MAG: hypothetical protein D6773_14135 [Alphaproteobacteria bacterium]